MKENTFENNNIVIDDTSNNDSQDFIEIKLADSVDNSAVVIPPKRNSNQLIADIIEVFETFLEDKGVILNNDEREYNPNDPECESANIYGTDYGELQSAIEDILVNEDIIIREW